MNFLIYFTCFAKLFISVLGVHPFTFNGSASRAEFTLVSSVNVSMDVSLRVRTRESSAVLIHIRQGYDRFFKMALDDGQINISFALNGDKEGISLGKIRLY